MTTTYDAAWVAEMEAKYARLEAEGLYHPDQEHASCGVGLVVAIDGTPSPAPHTTSPRHHTQSPIDGVPKAIRLT